MRPSAVAALILAAAAPAGAQPDLDAIQSATARQHAGDMAGVTAWTAEVVAMGQPFQLSARRAADGWEVRAAPAKADEMSEGVGGMLEGSVTMLLSAAALLEADDAFHLEAPEAVGGRAAHVLVLDAASGAGMEFADAAGGTVRELRLLVDEERRTISAISVVTDVSDEDGTRAATLRVEYADYGVRGPVTLPGRIRFRMTGLLPPMSEAERKQARTELAALREEVMALPEAQRREAEPHLAIMEEMILHGAMTMDAEILSVREGI